MIARGLEAAVLEDRFYEFVTSKDEEFRKIVARIVAEERAHQALIEVWARAAGA